MQQPPDRNAFTRRLLQDAGVRPGMRVLDLGCGHGEVSVLLAAMVGTSGQVVGVDRQAGAIDRARARARQEGLGNTTFVVHELSDAELPAAPFDAVVGRRVLMYLPVPAGVLATVAAALRPGGLAVFQEMDATATPVAPTPHPLHDRVNGWIWSTIAAEGADVQMGLVLSRLLRQSGLCVEHVRAEAEIEGQTGSMADIVRAILPRIVHHSRATEAEIGLDTLEQRLVAERERTGDIYIRNLTVGVWARKGTVPGAS